MKKFLYVFCLIAATCSLQALDSLRLTSPKGGEIYEIGENSIIRWEGVSVDDTVALDYSLDKGNSWKNITESATDLSYKWLDIPLPASDQCLIKVRNIHPDFEYSLHWYFYLHADKFNAVSWSPDGSKIAVGTDIHGVRILDVATERGIGTVGRYHSWIVTCVSWSPDGTKIAFGNSGGVIEIWDADTYKLITTLSGHQSTVFSVSWSPDCSQVVTGSFDNTVKIWDVVSGEEILDLSNHTLGVFGVDWSPDGTKIASGGKDRTVRVWDAKTGVEIMKLLKHVKPITGVQWSPDGSKIASGSQNRLIRIWDGITGSEIKTIATNHTQFISSISWSPDGNKIASGSIDTTIKIWDIQTGHEIISLNGITAICSIDWSSDGKRIVSGSRYHIVNVYNVGYSEIQSYVSDSFFSIAPLKPGITQIAPNPAWKNLHIKFTLADSVYTEIIIYDIKGRKIQTIFSEDVSDLRNDELSADIRKLAQGKYMAVFKAGKY